MTSISSQARMARFLYLLDIIVAPIRLAYIPDALVVAGDATTTANSIAAHEPLFRFGIVSNLFCCWVLEIFLVLALYRLLMAGGMVCAVMSHLPEGRVPPRPLSFHISCGVRRRVRELPPSAGPNRAPDRIGCHAARIGK